MRLMCSHPSAVLNVCEVTMPSNVSKSYPFMLVCFITVQVNCDVLSFTRHAESYEAVILFQGSLGETHQRLYVRGRGSYDGKHEAVLNI